LQTMTIGRGEAKRVVVSVVGKKPAPNTNNSRNNNRPARSNSKTKA